MMSSRDCTHCRPFTLRGTTQPARDGPGVAGGRVFLRLEGPIVIDLILHGV